MEYGHVKLSRKFFASDPFWNERRVFSRSEAWLDLIQRAAWKDHTRLVGGAVIELARGEILASIRFLASAWNWGEQKVRTFLALLKKMERISTQRETQAGTVYLLVNYDTYQGGNTESNTADDTPITHRQHTHNTKRSSKAVKAEKETTGARASRKAPRSFEPDEASRFLAKELGVDFAYELGKFRDHEFATPRSDWQGTWRNWLRKAAEMQGSKKPKQNGPYNFWNAPLKGEAA